eukprot:3991864-Alexandrium_andersonii.AAC.1
MPASEGASGAPLRGLQHAPGRTHRQRPALARCPRLLRRRARATCQWCSPWWHSQVGPHSWQRLARAKAPASLHRRSLKRRHCLHCLRHGPTRPLRRQQRGDGASGATAPPRSPGYRPGSSRWLQGQPVGHGWKEEQQLRRPVALQRRMAERTGHQGPIGRCCNARHSRHAWQGGPLPRSTSRRYGL